MDEHSLLCDVFSNVSGSRCCKYETRHPDCVTSTLLRFVVLVSHRLFRYPMYYVVIVLLLRATKYN